RPASAEAAPLAVRLLRFHIAESAAWATADAPPPSTWRQAAACRAPPCVLHHPKPKRRQSPYLRLFGPPPDKLEYRLRVSRLFSTQLFVRCPGTVKCRFI